MVESGALALSWAEQDLEKREAAAEKKRESIMVNFNQARTQVSSLEANLARTQVELEKVSFDLQAKKGNSNFGFRSPRAVVDLIEDLLRAGRGPTEVLSQVIASIDSVLCHLIIPFGRDRCNFSSVGWASM